MVVGGSDALSAASADNWSCVSAKLNFDAGAVAVRMIATTADADGGEGRDADGRHPEDRLTAPDRHLEEAVRELGQHQGDGQPPIEQQRPLVDVGLLPQSQEDRPVVEVHAVGDPTEVAQRSDREQPGHGADGQDARR